MKSLNVYDLINVLARKFKFDRHNLSEAKIESLRVVYKVSFRSAQLLYDFVFFINHDFFNIRLKCLKKINQMLFRLIEVCFRENRLFFSSFR